MERAEERRTEFQSQVLSIEENDTLNSSLHHTTMLWDLLYNQGNLAQWVDHVESFDELQSATSLSKELNWKERSLLRKPSKIWSKRPKLKLQRVVCWECENNWNRGMLWCNSGSVQEKRKLLRKRVNRTWMSALHGPIDAFLILVYIHA